ncbi:MAG: SMP-30/gluconolactonase/LRE family protein [Burkholderiales bacterium]|nr:SMP-30/gluconolactonase/LRE family protein [Burkholderiales bacterium]
MQWHTVARHHCELGESPFWHPQEQTLYWVDIVGRQILRANVYMGTVEAWDMPSEPGCIAPAASGGLVIALRHGIFRAREWRGALQPIVTLPYDTTTVRANDGKCDPLGRFWVGTLDESKTHRAAGLYAVDCRQGRTPLVRQHVADALTANGLAWSPDGHTLYWADTPNHRVKAWDCDLQSNTLSAPRVFQSFAPKPDGWQWGAPMPYGGRPDGAAVDVQGNYWVALYEGQRVCQFAPGGRLLMEIPTPTPCPTMPCFGGEDLKTLYLTSARHGRSARELAAFPQSGCVFSTRVDVTGLPVSCFVDD